MRYKLIEWEKPHAYRAVEVSEPGRQKRFYNFKDFRFIKPKIAKELETKKKIYKEESY
jgi:hypothetical protein